MRSLSAASPFSMSWTAAPRTQCATGALTAAGQATVPVDPWGATRRPPQSNEIDAARPSTKSQRPLPKPVRTAKPAAHGTARTTAPLATLSRDGATRCVPSPRFQPSRTPLAKSSSPPPQR